MNQNGFKNIINDKCKMRKVKLLLKFFPNENSTEQIALSCYGAPSVIPFNTQLEDYIFYNKIVIYPANIKEMMLFEKNENADNYTLVGWMTFRNWNRVSINENELNIPIPKMLMGLNADLTEYSLNVHNKLLCMKCVIYTLVCILSKVTLKYFLIN